MPAPSHIWLRLLSTFPPCHGIPRDLHASSIRSASESLAAIGFSDTIPFAPDLSAASTTMSALYRTGRTQSTMSSSSFAYISSADEYPRASNRLHASARLSGSGSAIATTRVSSSSVNPRACCVPCRPHPTIPTLYFASTSAISPPLLKSTPLLPPLPSYGCAPSCRSY